MRKLILPQFLHFEEWKCSKLNPCIFYHIINTLGGARGVMVIVVGNGHGDTSSYPGQDWLHFT